MEDEVTEEEEAEKARGSKGEDDACSFCVLILSAVLSIKSCTVFLSATRFLNPSNAACATPRKGKSRLHSNAVRHGPRQRERLTRSG